MIDRGPQLGHRDRPVGEHRTHVVTAAQVLRQRRRRRARARPGRRAARRRHSAAASRNVAAAGPVAFGELRGRAHRVHEVVRGVDAAPSPCQDVARSATSPATTSTRSRPRTAVELRRRPGQAAHLEPRLEQLGHEPAADVAASRPSPGPAALRASRRSPASLLPFSRSRHVCSTRFLPNGRGSKPPSAAGAECSEGHGAPLSLRHRGCDHWSGVEA